VQFKTILVKAGENGLTIDSRTWKTFYGFGWVGFTLFQVCVITVLELVWK